MVVRALADNHGVAMNRRKFLSLFGQNRIDNKDVLLVQPSTFMNLSGHAVGQWVKHLGEKMSCCIVIHDDLDLPFGRIRIRRHGSHGGHRGIRSIIETLGTDDFIRVKIGIGSPGEQPPELYVLHPFSPEESRLLNSIIRRGCEAVEAVIGEGAELAMNRFNAPLRDLHGAEAE
jgi:PTH1 family peptidyl-tRNA hydrolase